MTKTAAGVVLFFFWATVCLLVFSYSTSPLYVEPGGMYDSSIFQFIGKNWLDGYVPYRDLWDNKGPLVFLINAAGYALTGNSLGVFVLQALSLATALCFAHRLLREAFASVTATLLTLVAALALVNVLEEGNLVDEYCVPWLMVSCWLLYRWAKFASTSQQIKHPAGLATVYGITAGVCALMRPTIAMGLCGALLVVITMLAWHRQWRNLLANAAMFLAGFAALTVPFLFYFWQTGSWDDFWFATFGFNLDYSNNPIMRSASMTTHQIGSALKSYLNCYAMLAVTIVMLACSRRRGLYAALWLTAALSLTAWYLHGTPEPHYAQASWPFFAVVMVELKELAQERNIALRRLAHTGMAAFTLLTIASAANEAISLRNVGHGASGANAAYAELLKDLPQNERKSVVGYNCSIDLYTRHNVMPCYSLFGGQEKGARLSNKYRSKLLGQLNSQKAKWIVVNTRNEVDHITPVLRNHYSLVKQVAYFNLYHLNI